MESGEGKVLVGTFSDNSVRMTDIAIDLDGRMYGIASTDLYRIDAQTAEVTFQCTVDQYANGLTFISNGQLLAAGAGIFIIDLNTCLTTTVSNGDGFQTAGDVVGLPGERLFWTVNGSAGDGLVEVNPNTGEKHSDRLSRHQLTLGRGLCGRSALRLFVFWGCRGHRS